MHSGILLVDKPIGVSSQYVVTGVKWAFGAKKAGHTGTLDVMASGMLPVCLNEATKFSRFMLNRDKTYTATVRLGQATTTGDVEGEVRAIKAVPRLTSSAVEAVLETFLGESMQTPPMYSALKHQGQPLYALARQGKDIARQARPITIHAITLLHMDLPTITCRVQCAKGTYVRTLFEDVAEALGTVGHLTALRRDSVGGFDPHQMHDFQAIKADPESFHPALLAMDAVLPMFPQHTLSDADAVALHHGLVVPAGVLSAGIVRLYTPQHHFMGLGEVQAGHLRVLRLLSQAARDADIAGGSRS